MKIGLKIALQLFRQLQVVQEIKVLRASVSQREREKAEKATLKVQEKLIKSKARPSLHDS